MTKAEAIRLACVLHSALRGGTVYFPASIPWYQTYFDYAAVNGISPGIYDYNAPATRSVFATYIYNAMPEAALEAINNVSGDMIIDVPDDSSYREAVYSLYGAGVLTGSDGFGSVSPDSVVTRAQACAVALRAIQPSYRARFSLPESLPATEVYRRCEGAMLYVETYDEYGELIRTGSAFFISPDGTAATNLHVLTGAHSVVLMTSDGVTREFLGVNAYSVKNDLALFRVDGEGFTYLLTTDTATLRTGDPIYSLGSPFGLDGTFSRGIVSNLHREYDGRSFVQFSSYISQGSGGGALLNGRGRVVGVTSSSFGGGQALNLATPSRFLHDLRPGALINVTQLPPV
jgi:S1-C subfamily serine protease